MRKEQFRRYLVYFIVVRPEDRRLVWAAAAAAAVDAFAAAAWSLAAAAAVGVDNAIIAWTPGILKKEKLHKISMYVHDRNVH